MLTDSVASHFFAHGNNRTISLMPRNGRIRSRFVTGYFGKNRGIDSREDFAFADMLVELGFQVNIYSVTSYLELAREAQACERWNRLHPLEEPRASYLQKLFEDTGKVFVAASDYMKSLPESISRWMGTNYSVLGTDGYGLSETRPALRAYFEINPQHIVLAALQNLAQQGFIDTDQVLAAIAEFGIDTEKTNPVER